MHAPPWVPARHLLMEDPAARGHPLHVTRSESALVSEAVAVVDGPREDVRDRFDPPMGVPGEPREVILGVLVAKVVEQEEGIELLRVAEAERAAHPHPRAFDGGFSWQTSLARSTGRGCSQKPWFRPLSSDFLLGPWVSAHSFLSPSIRSCSS